MADSEDNDTSEADNANLKFLTWAGYLEDLIAKWSDNALSYAWLHNKAEAKYRKLNYSFTIPIVILSTLVGTINVGMNSLFPENMVKYGQITIGGVGIFTGILGTLQNFFKYAQLSEAHRNVAIQWHKFHRSLKTELALESICRRSAGEFFRSSKSELDRLLDSSPYIPSDIVQRYLEENNIELPDVIGNLQKTLVFRGGMRLSPKNESPYQAPSPTQKTTPNEAFVKISRDSLSNQLSSNALYKRTNTINESLNLSEDDVNQVKNIVNEMNGLSSIKITK
jgi:hypothetical protein